MQAGPISPHPDPLPRGEGTAVFRTIEIRESLSRIQTSVFSVTEYNSASPLPQRDVPRPRERERVVLPGRDRMRVVGKVQPDWSGPG